MESRERPTWCGWPQGALATAEAYHSDVPHPCEQVKDWWFAIPRGTYDESTWWQLQRLVESFSEEVWGSDAIKTPADRRTPLTRRPTSGEIAKVLDEAFGASPIPKWWPRQEGEVERRRERVELLAKILAPLKCQICAEVGNLKYLPRLLLPIDADLTAESQTQYLTSLAAVFETARRALSSDVRLRQVIWIPKAFPRLRLSELARRLELRHEARPRSTETPEHNWWLIAMWLADVSATSRRKTRKGETDASPQRKRRKAKPQWTWDRILDELGVPAPSPGVPQADVDQQLHQLRVRVDKLRGRPEKLHLLIPGIRQLLVTDEHRAAAAMLAGLFEAEVLPQKLTDLRRKT